MPSIFSMPICRKYGESDLGMQETVNWLISTENSEKNLQHLLERNVLGTWMTSGNPQSNVTQQSVSSSFKTCIRDVNKL